MGGAAGEQIQHPLPLQLLERRDQPPPQLAPERQHGRQVLAQVRRSMVMPFWRPFQNPLPTRDPVGKTVTEQRIRQHGQQGGREAEAEGRGLLRILRTALQMVEQGKVTLQNSLVEPVLLQTARLQAAHKR